MAGSASISGLASGLDTATIISQLMQLESVPQTRLKSRVGTEQTALTALQGFNTKFSVLASKAAELAKADGWAAVKATSSYDKVSITTTSGAQPTSLSFTVLSTAKAHVVSSTTPASSLSAVVMTTGNKDLSLTIGGTAHTIPTGGGTLQEVVDAVNGAQLGVTAAALDLGNGTYGLYVEADTAGAASTFTLTRANGQALMGGMATATQGSDASVEVAGLTVTSTTNTFANLVPGATITLGDDAVAGTAVTTTVATDTTSITDKVKGLVDQLNSLLNDIDTSTQTGAGKVKGVLAGDSTLRSLRDQLVSSIYAVAGGTLASVGIQLDRSAQFTFDEAKFKEAYAADPVKTASYFTTPDATGFADRLAAVAKGASDSTTGTLTTAINGRKTAVDRLNQNIEDWDIRLELRRTTLSRQFTALETALGQMNSQSSWLAGQISSLPKMSS